MQSRLDIIFETVNLILAEGKGSTRGAGRKRNLKKARQRIKSDMRGLARVEDEMSDISGVQDRFYTPERAGREEELDQSYGKIQDRIATAKRRIERRS